MAREKKIIDASVIIKWFVNEPYSEKALELRDDHINGRILIVVPELAFLEVLNALRYKEHDARALEQVNTDLWEIQLHVEKLNRFLLDKASQIALKYNLTLYDGLYAALANLFGAQLITADAKLGNFPNSVLLKER